VPSPLHPFLVFNIYRFDGVRFEQIAMSWVKHGVQASQSNTCGLSCRRFGDRIFLGPGCSDVYGVGTNADQRGLGPRSEIDPYTGAFTYEGSHFDTEGAQHDHEPLDHLLRVHDDGFDSEVHPGARYFLELQVVAHDDVDHGNSIGYKEFTVLRLPESEWDLHYLEAEARPGSVLNAWHRAEVTEIETPDGSDGRLVLGSKVTDNDDGTWHYEYALFNLDCSRAVGTFTVPVPEGIAVSNIDFHAPESDADGFSNEPWVSSRSEESITWSTQPFDLDPMANSLRWGALYNFSFDADRAPGGGSIRLSPHRPIVDGPGAKLELEAVAPTPAGEPVFRRGDSDASGLIDIGDAVMLASYLFLGTTPPTCLDAADADDSGVLDLSDILVPLLWLFSGNSPPPAPGPSECGVDPTPEEPRLVDCVYDPRSC